MKINFITSEGEKITINANIGDSIMDITQAHDIDLECLFDQIKFINFNCSIAQLIFYIFTIWLYVGACEGSLACSTCHVIVDPEYYDKLDEPTDEENDMLDLAFGLTET